MRTDKVALLTCESEIGLCSPPIPLTSRRESCYANLERIVQGRTGGWVVKFASAVYAITGKWQMILCGHEL
jgi:hypothetical protein